MDQQQPAEVTGRRGEQDCDHDHPDPVHCSGSHGVRWPNPGPGRVRLEELPDTVLAIATHLLIFSLVNCAHPYVILDRPFQEHFKVPDNQVALGRAESIEPRDDEPDISLWVLWIVRRVEQVTDHLQPVTPLIAAVLRDLFSCMAEAGEVFLGELAVGPAAQQGKYPVEQAFAILVTLRESGAYELSCLRRHVPLEVRDADPVLFLGRGVAGDLGDGDVAVNGLGLEADVGRVSRDVGRAARDGHDMPFTAVMMAATLAARSATSAIRPRSFLSASMSLLLPGSVLAASEPATTSSSASAARYVPSSRRPAVRACRSCSPKAATSATRAAIWGDRSAGVPGPDPKTTRTSPWMSLA